MEREGAGEGEMWVRKGEEREDVRGRIEACSSDKFLNFYDLS